jgi:hypothetical protein
VLPIKIFLGQVRDLLGGSHNPDELNNLGGYLRTLDSTKKELLQLLKEQINELAELYKDLEIKIESTYLALRRNVLIQVLCILFSQLSQLSCLISCRSSSKVILEILPTSRDNLQNTASSSSTRTINPKSQIRLYLLLSTTRLFPSKSSNLWGTAWPNTERSCKKHARRSRPSRIPR